MKISMKLVVCVLGVCGLAMTAGAQDVVTSVVGGGPNNIPGINANLYNPYEVAVDAAGNVYVAASAQNRVFKINAAGIETLVAGTGTAGYGGDGKAATVAQLNDPWGVAVDGANPANVYIADTGNCLVRKVAGSTGVITTIAGTVTVPASGNPYTSCGYAGDGGRANAAELYQVAGLALNPVNNDLYIADFNEGVIRKVAGGTATGTISTVAGSGGSASGENCQGSKPYGDGGPAKSATFVTRRGWCWILRRRRRTCSSVNQAAAGIAMCARWWGRLRRYTRWQEVIRSAADLLTM